MTPHTATAHTAAHTATAVPACDRRTRVTRSLLGYGIIAGPLYVTVSLAQALTREGFDLTRHAWSLLANGDLGWIQITNLLVAGLAVIAAALGMRRGLAGGPGARWTPRLVAGYGLGLLASAVFTADPSMGFPAGTPQGPGAVSTHGLLHLAAGAAGAVGFAALIAATLVHARRLAADGRPAAAAWSRTTGVLFALAFACVATGGGAVWANLAFTAGILIAWTWLSVTSLRLYRAAGR
ncbi:DUF998 domain-containing protein [Spongiactinospora sp. TRM90649]|uniref:DUF998 domain-containing protein n=1 Tax=Spongiactinospora sp. TRM90649 TaxID=3031114 RepID=UPI0023FA31EB|nr:DUF998 domain-containing protein [Spongiactinospora sp. TRM90649]MDF5756112.1 DUF998 domain-containing protein [Spongiactinospora sp. TRM90649]